MVLPVVSAIYVYPIKSAGGIERDMSGVGRMGFQYDRQWMVIDEHGMFVAQRQSDGLGVGIKSMSQVRTKFSGHDLVCTAPGMDPLRIPLRGIKGDAITSQVWRSECVGFDQGRDASTWFTDFLSRERAGTYRLIRMPDDPWYGFRRAKRGDAHVGYADADPFLIISQESLNDLNIRIGGGLLPMNRFRPNVVVSGCEPYAEDTWGNIVIGRIRFTGTKECVRCPITTQDQDTTIRGAEPLRTLANYRRVPSEGVIFGMNFIHEDTAGFVGVGDVIVVSKTRTPLLSPTAVR